MLRISEFQSKYSLNFSYIVLKRSIIDMSEVWNSVNNWTEMHFRPVIWLSLHLILRFSFYSIPGVDSTFRRLIRSRSHSVAALMIQNKQRERNSAHLAVKTKPCYGGWYTLFWVWNQNGGDKYFGYFSRLGNVQQYHSKGLGESFPLMWLSMLKNYSLNLKWSFFD